MLPAAVAMSKERIYIMKKDCKLFPIKNGRVTLYVHTNNGTQFDFKGFTVKGDGNFYMPYISAYFGIDLDGRPCTSIEDHLFEKYKPLADAQLAEYLEEHIHGTLIATDFSSFWYTAGKTLAFIYDKNLHLDRMLDGLVGIEINHTICIYNFAAGKPVGYRALYRNEELATTPLKVFYGDRLIQMLLLEQYRRGLAPPVYAELARLNTFLEGKKSVKLVMKDGAVHEYKHHNGGDIYLSTLFNYAPNSAMPFCLNDCYDIRPRFNRSRPLADLDYLQYGKHRFVIDLEALFTAVFPLSFLVLFHVRKKGILHILKLVA